MIVSTIGQNELKFRPAANSRQIFVNGKIDFREYPDLALK